MRYEVWLKRVLLFLYRKSVPGSPRCPPLNPGGVGVMGLNASSSGGVNATSPKATIVTPPSSMPNAARIAPSMASVAPPTQRSLVSYSQGAPYSSQTTTSSVGAAAAQLTTVPAPAVATPAAPATSTGIQGAFHRSYTYVIVGTAKFFGVDAASEKVSQEVWNDRRRRIAIKKFGGVKDEYALRDGAGTGANGGQYSQYGGGGGVGGGSGDGRFRTFSDQHHHLTSEPEGDKMVLKITKPPRNKDSLGSLTGQGISYLVNVSLQLSMILYAFNLVLCDEVFFEDLSVSLRHSSSINLVQLLQNRWGFIICINNDSDFSQNKRFPCLEEISRLMIKQDFHLSEEGRSTNSETRKRQPTNNTYERDD